MDVSIDTIISNSLTEGLGSREYYSCSNVCNNYPLIYPFTSMSEDNNKIHLDFTANLKDNEAWEQISTSSFFSNRTSAVLFGKNDNGYDIRTLVHDFTFGCLTQTTDIALKTYIDGTNIPSYLIHLLDKTPDYLTVIDGILTLVEFGTCASGNHRDIKKYYDIKMDYYSSAMESLAPYLVMPYKVFVVIVGPNGVGTNMVLGNDLEDTLVYRYRVIRSIDDSLHESGIKVRLMDKTLSQDVDKLIRSFAIMKIEGEDEYSYENYKRLMTERIDPKVLSKIVDTCWSQSMKQVDKRNWFRLQAEGIRQRQSLKQITLLVSNLIESNLENAPDGFNTHMKSIVNIPMVLLRTGTSSISIKTSKFMTVDWDKTHDDEVLRLWIKAKAYIEDNDDFVDNSEISDAYEDLVKDPEYMRDFLSDQPSLGPKPSDTRNLYSRVKLEIDQEDAIDLAKVGIQAKKFVRENEPAVKEYRKSRQLPFGHLTTDVQDIDELFASDLSWMLDTDISFRNSNYSQRILSLIEQGRKIHGHSELSTKYGEHLTEITKTPFFQWSSWLSDIAFELCLALRQSCKKNVFIIKKLKNFQCYILIKPVRLSSKIFFSLLWLNDDVLFSPGYTGNVFRVANSNRDVSWTGFVSLDQCKIENWALAESRTLAMVPYWLEFHGLPPFTLTAKGIAEVELHMQALQMMMFYTLIEIADKSEIEQEASLFRYMFMKSLVARPLVPDPELVIKKFKANPRSRLTVWIQRKLVQYCVYVAGDNIQVHQEDLDLHDQSLSTNSTKRMIWRGLRNPYNNAVLRNPGDAVNLMYIGYVQNKNLQPEANVFGKMLEKILVLEDDFTPEIQERIGREDKPLTGNTKHEYNITLLREATRFVKDTYIPKLHGPSGLSQKVEDIMRKIAGTPIEEVFTTLKASSNFDSKFFELTEEEYHRAKVIEKAQTYVHGDETKIMDIIKTCHQEVDENGYMRIDIFQKNQHGGIREIYVLGFAERVIQWVIEGISRGLCELFPGETMTHPENKKRLPDEYFKNLRIRNCGKPVMTVATSADASKWSQNMYPHKFAVMLCMLLPEYLHGFIWTTLAFWKNKYIMIPQSLIRRFHEKDNLIFYNKYMSGLYGAYKGVETQNWAEKDKAFIVVKTGMMQGILHYTSSLFHSIMNVHIEALSMKFFQKVTGVPLEPLIMQSSDDSCEILSCEIQESNMNRLSALYSLSVVQFFKSEMGSHVGIVNSEEKTVYNVENVYEFNSAYHFGPSRYESDIKMLSSSLICTDRENMVDRHMEQYTQLTNFINAGGSIYSANFIQSAQAFFNYRLLGSSVTSRFSLLAQCYSILPDPNLGFFAMDNPLFTGLSGYKYNLWKIVSNTSVGKTYKYYLNEALKPSERNKKPDLITTKNGVLAKRAILGFGNRQKLLAIIKRMELPDDWQEQLDSDPSLYFRRSQNEEEFKILCAMKMYSPGVQESLSTGNITTRIMASSAYITLSTVMKSIGDWQTKEDMDLNEFKIADRYNLLQLISHEMNILLQETSSLEEEEKNFLFPYQEEYLALESKLASCDYNIPKRKMMDYRRVITEVRVFERDNVTAIPPEKVMAALWFRDNELVKKPRYSMKYLEDCYKRLRKVIPWLSDNLQETLENGPFDHINSLAAWLSQFHQKDKIVVIIGAPIVCRRGSSSILAVIRQNFHKLYEIENRIIDNDSITSNEFSAIRQAVLMTMSYPSDKVGLERRITQVLSSKIGGKLIYNPSASKSRYNSLCIMRDAVSNAVEPLETLERISESRIGIVGGYSMQQEFDVQAYQYHGSGIWIGKFYDRKVKLEINSYYDDTSSKHVSYLQRIFLDDIHPTQDVSFCLRTWLEENNISENIPEHLRSRNREETRAISIVYARRAGLTSGIKAYYHKGRITDNADGIPVVVDPTIINYFGSLTEFKIDVPINPSTLLPTGVIKLVGKTDQMTYRGERPKWITLLRYVVHHKDYEGPGSVSLGITMTDANRCWVENRSMSAEKARDIINHTIRRPEDEGMYNHVKEVLRESFSRRGFKLGRKRDELPLTKSAYVKYVEGVEMLGGSPEKKVPNIPSVEELLTHTVKPLRKKATKKLTWAEDIEDDEISKMDEDNLMKDESQSGDSFLEDNEIKVRLATPSGSEDEGSEGEEEESEIDWGSDDSDCMERIEMIEKKMIEEQISFANIDREIITAEAGDITIDFDMDFGKLQEEDLDYLGDRFFKDLEMFNSSEYYISQTVNETNMRLGLVKKEHCWFNQWIKNWITTHRRDLSKLFHERTVTKAIRDSGFMTIMNFIYPGIDLIDEKETIRHEMVQISIDPFDDDMASEENDVDVEQV